MKNKLCKKCNKAKDLSQFHKDKTHKDGVRTSCKECRALECLGHYKKNRDKILEEKRQYYQKNKPLIRQKVSIYKKQNPDKARACETKSVRKRRELDLIFRLKGNISALIAGGIKRAGYKKTTRTHTILGCSYNELHLHLVRTAISNYGFWDENRNYHIDHIIPMSTAETLDNLIKLNHYSNLQYLYAEHNLNKSDKLNWRIDLFLDKK